MIRTASKDSLIKLLLSIDGKSYQKYKELSSSYELDDVTLYIDKIQNEAASSSFMRLRTSLKKAGFPADTYDTKIKGTALRDLIARRFWESCRMYAKGNSDGNTGGMISIPRPGQEIMERSCVVLSETFIEVRFKASLPSAGRNAAGRSAAKMLTEDLAEIARSSLFYASYKSSKLYGHINTAVTANNIRSSLRERGLAAFIADGSTLPRRDDGLAPMNDAVPFRSPDTLLTSFPASDGGTVKGMGIPEGLTAVIGATGHGKTTLIEAIASGVYDHIPGDGRELVITADDAVVITRDVGRPVGNVDVSMFICDAGRNVRSLSADHADDALSSAASAAEMMEIGSRLLIMDDMSVSHGLLYSDERICGLIPAGDETMIPISETMRDPNFEGMSAIVACRHGDLTDNADTVIIMSKHAVADAIRSFVIVNVDFPHPGGMPADRIPMARNMNVSKGKKEVSAAALSASKAEIGETVIRIPYPVKDVGEMSSIADAILDAKEIMDGTATLKEVAEHLESIYRERIRSADENMGPDRAAFRRYDLAAVINRHPDIVFGQRSPPNR